MGLAGIELRDSCQRTVHLAAASLISELGDVDKTSHTATSHDSNRAHGLSTVAQPAQGLGGRQVLVITVERLVESQRHCDLNCS